MTTIVIILAAIAVVWVCLETTRSHEPVEYCEEGFDEPRQDNQCHVIICDGYGYYDSLAAPLDGISDDKNPVECNNVSPGRSNCVNQNLSNRG